MYAKKMDCLTIMNDTCYWIDLKQNMNHGRIQGNEYSFHKKNMVVQNLLFIQSVEKIDQKVTKQ